jgi:hypothetical protein
LHIAAGTYNEIGSFTFPNYPLVVYGNGALLNCSGTITVQNPNYSRYDLNTTGTVVFSGSTAGRVLVQGGSIVGNMTVNGLTDFKSITLASGTITVNSTGQLLIIASTITSVITGSGIILLENNNFNATKSGYLITSLASGSLAVANNIIVNLGSGGGISCNNTANGITRLNLISNNTITTGGTPVAVGTAVTAYSKNVVSGAITGTGYIPVNSDIVGAGTIMGLGSDATGDIYYRAGSGILTRLGIGSSGSVLKSNGSSPVWGSASVGHTIQYNSSSLPFESNLNFLGSGVSVVDDPTHNSTNITISSGSGSSGSSAVTLTGDVTGSGTGSVVTTLAASGVSAGSYTNPTITFDAKGRATSASNGNYVTGVSRYLKCGKSAAQSFSAGVQDTVVYVANVATNLTWDGTNNRCVVPEAGLYFITAAVSAANISTALRIRPTILINGIGLIINEIVPPTVNGIYPTAVITQVLSLNASDAISIAVYATSSFTTEASVTTNYLVISKLVANPNIISVTGLNATGSVVSNTDATVLDFTNVTTMYMVSSGSTVQFFSK